MGMMGDQLLSPEKRFGNESSQMNQKLPKNLKMFETKQLEDDDENIATGNNVNQDHPGTSTFGAAQEFGIGTKKAAAAGSLRDSIHHFKIEVEPPTTERTVREEIKA